MLAQVGLPLEGAAALVARERLEARVFATVCDEVGRLTEGLVAVATHVRLLACNTTTTRLVIIQHDDDTVSQRLRCGSY